MKAKKFLWVLTACILSLSLVAFAACDTGESDQFTVESVSLQETAEIKVGASVTLKYTVEPEGCTDTVTWRSSDTSVATVSNGSDNAGQVTGVAAGEATITLQVGNLTDTCTVIVTQNETVAVTGIELNKTELTLAEGGSETLTATVTPDNATDKTVTWTSNKTDVATVENGVVTAVGEGTATITATAGGKSAACTVTVLDGSNVVNVDTAEELVAAVANSDNAGKTIVLAEDEYTLTETVFVTQDITLEGNNSTLTAGSTPWADVTNGRASIITVTNGADVTIRNLTVTGAKQSGSVYGHGVNLAQAGSVTLENVTATNNSGVGVLVNDTVATLKNVTTSGNAWGGVNVDVIGRDWDVPATVLTVDEACDFAEDAQIYCDDADEELALSWEGVLVLPDSYHKIGVVGTETIVWSDAVDTDTTIDTITIGGKNYTLTYATNGTAYESNDTDPDWWEPGTGTGATGLVNVSGDFAIVYKWDKVASDSYTGGEFNTDAAVEVIDGSQYYDVQIGFGGDTGWGTPALPGETAYTGTLTKNGQPWTEENFPGMSGSAMDTEDFSFYGIYETIVVRVGSQIVIQSTFVQFDTNDTYTYTYIATYSTTNNVAVQIVGNPYGLSNITCTQAALTEITA